MTDTTREAVEILIGLIDHNKSWEGLQEVDVEAYQQAADTLRALFARADAAEKMVRKLVALNDDYSPFGGEILEDRIERTWEEARAFIATLDQPKENDDE